MSDAKMNGHDMLDDALDDSVAADAPALDGAALECVAVDGSALDRVAADGSALDRVAADGPVPANVTVGGKSSGSGVRELKRILKFVLFSASAGLIELGSFTLLNELLHLPYWLSYLIALILSVLWNFTFNRKFTFKSTANVPVAMLKVIAYYLVFTPLSTGLEHWYTMGLGWNEYVATILNMLLNLTTEFLYQRFFVFGKTIDTQPVKGKVSDKAS